MIFHKFFLAIRSGRSLEMEDRPHKVMILKRKRQVNTSRPRKRRNSTKKKKKKRKRKRRRKRQAMRNHTRKKSKKAAFNVGVESGYDTRHNPVSHVQSLNKPTKSIVPTSMIEWRKASPTNFLTEWLDSI